MQDALTPIQASEIVTSLCAFIVAGALCYIVKLVLHLKEDMRDIRESLAVHFSEDKGLSARIERIEENIDRIMKLRIIRRRDDDD